MLKFWKLKVRIDSDGDLTNELIDIDNEIRNIYNKTMKVYKIENDSSAKKFSRMLKKGEWLVFYYADWCGHCHHMQPEWESFIKLFSLTDRPRDTG